jgi:hypothetical protein
LLSNSVPLVCDRAAGRLNIRRTPDLGIAKLLSRRPELAKDLHRLGRMTRVIFLLGRPLDRPVVGYTSHSTPRLSAFRRLSIR